MMFFLGLVVFDHVRQPIVGLSRNVVYGRAEGSLRTKYKTPPVARKSRATAQAFSMSPLAAEASQVPSCAAAEGDVQFLREGRFLDAGAQIEGIHSRRRYFSSGRSGSGLPRKTDADPFEIYRAPARRQPFAVHVFFEIKRSRGSWEVHRKLLLEGSRGRDAFYPPQLRGNAEARRADEKGRPSRSRLKLAAESQGSAPSTSCSLNLGRNDLVAEFRKYGFGARPKKLIVRSSATSHVMHLVSALARAACVKTWTCFEAASRPWLPGRPRSLWRAQSFAPMENYRRTRAPLAEGHLRGPQSSILISRGISIPASRIRTMVCEKGHGLRAGRSRPSSRILFPRRKYTETVI